MNFSEKMVKLASLTIGFVIVLGISLAQAGDIRIVTEEYPPYNYTENGQVKGLGTEVVLAVLDQLGMKIPIEVNKWSRTYHLAQKGPRTLIFSIGRNEKREKLFKWVGTIAPYNVCAIALTSRPDIQITSLEDMKKYTTGTLKDEVTEQYLVSKGFVIGQHIQQTNNRQANIRKLFAKRIDLLFLPYLVAKSVVKNAGFDPTALRCAFQAEELTTQLWMAFSPDTPDETVKQFQDALETIKIQGKMDQILSKYLK